MYGGLIPNQFDNDKDIIGLSACQKKETNLIYQIHQNFKN